MESTGYQARKAAVTLLLSMGASAFSVNDGSVTSPVATGYQAGPPMASTLSSAKSAAEPVAAEKMAEKPGCADS